MVAYRIPAADWFVVARELVNRLANLLTRTVQVVNGSGDPDIFLVPTNGVLTPAVLGSTNASNDWENEIHPTPGGYRKLTAILRLVIEAQFR
jgi:lysophospholipase L1-like esterase